VVNLLRLRGGRFRVSVFKQVESFPLAVTRSFPRDAVGLPRSVFASQSRTPIEGWSYSYVVLVEELRRVVAEVEKDAQELLRWMCFDALISNLDDNPRNHPLITCSTVRQVFQHGILSLVPTHPTPSGFGVAAYGHLSI